jgi:hypothetical protein
VVGYNIVIRLDILYMWSIYVLIFGCWDLRWRMYGTYWTCGQCCLSDMQVVGSNIAIGLYVLDMWLVLCVPYVGDGI